MSAKFVSFRTSEVKFVLNNDLLFEFTVGSCVHPGCPPSKVAAYSFENSDTDIYPDNELSDPENNGYVIRRNEGAIMLRLFLILPDDSVDIFGIRLGIRTVNCPYSCILPGGCLSNEVCSCIHNNRLSFAHLRHL